MFTALSDDWDKYQGVPFLRERIDRDMRGELEWLLGRGPADAHPWSADLVYVNDRGWQVKPLVDQEDG